MMNKRRLVIVALLAGSATSCTVGPNFKRPPQDIPAAFKRGTTRPATAPATLARDWWKLFNDPTLDALEQAALESNTDLRAAVSRVTQARAAARVAGSDFYPVITFDPAFSRSRTPGSSGGSGLNVAGDGTVTNGTGGGNRGRTSNSVRIPLDLTYEVDVWGKIRRSVEVADAQAEASAADYEVVLQTIEADVAQNYFAIRSLSAQEQILADTVASYRRQVELIQAQLRAGLLGQTDAFQADAQLQTTISDQIEIKRQREDLEHALAILLGKTPDALLLVTGPLDVAPPAVPAGLPSDLLRRRPDVAEAEQNLIAANAQVGVATALFYPDISLSGVAGFESTDLRHALDWEQRIWSIGAGATLPIFEGGRLKANLEQTRARYAELQATYRGSVLRAIRDVEDSLTDLHYRADQAVVLDRAVKSSQEYLRLSQQQYKQGLIGYLQVIDAQRTLLTNQLSSAQLLNQRLVSSVLLIKALGGGWEAPAATRGSTTRSTAKD